MNIFAEKQLSTFFESGKISIRNEVESQQDSYILNVDEQRFIESLVSQYTLENIEMKFDEMTVSGREELIPGEMFPSIEFMTRPGKEYPKQVITYHIPYSGESSLLECTPSTRIMWTTEVSLVANCVCFDVIDFWGDGNRVKQKADENIRHIKTQLEHLRKEVEQFNKDLPRLVRDLFNARKQKIMKNNDVLQTLGVPIRKTSNTPETFTIPTVRKRVIPRPQVSATASKPVPVISDEIYQDILRTIYEMGKTFERYPSTYKDKDEEMLRDHLILQLEPRYEGSTTTGETFNRGGKTDILMRYEGVNVFVAECKFWRGQSEHQKAIDQLLDYLTWRDSKTALVYFVDRKQMKPIVDELEADTAKHKCYVKKVNQKDESWQLYEFHLKDDPACRIQLTILAFHIPK